MTTTRRHFDLTEINEKIEQLQQDEKESYEDFERMREFWWESSRNERMLAAPNARRIIIDYCNILEADEERLSTELFAVHQLEVDYYRTTVSTMNTTRQVLNRTYPRVQKEIRRSLSDAESKKPGIFSMTAPLWLQPWESFEHDLLTCMDSVPDISLENPFTAIQPSPCGYEPDVCNVVADRTLFEPLQELVKTLCPTFSYLNECIFCYPQNHIHIGSPDRAWAMKESRLSKMLVEFKSPFDFAFPERDIIWAYNNGWDQLLNRRTAEKDKFVCAVEQIYTYMAINGHRYGCLSTFDQTWFFKRTDDLHPQQPQLLVTPAIKCGQTEPYTLMSAWLYTILKIEKDNDWKYPTPCCRRSVPPLLSAMTRAAGKERYRLVPLDGLVHWQTILVHSQHSTVATGTFMDLDYVVFKIVDISKVKRASTSMDREVQLYEMMEDLQGLMIPRFIASGSLGGFLRVIILEHVGRNTTPEELVARRDEIDNVMQLIKAKGQFEDDEIKPKAMVNENGLIRFVDFGQSQLSYFRRLNRAFP
ncbi:hypothetical protein HDV03_002286 [Kappamyces sp. JEL0829]|nr:hypothetical protein HDV03_002286 [Kappamyces sp. JEL0829]